MYARAEDVPPRPPFPTDDNSSGVTVAAISSEKIKHSAYDNTYICMLFAKATDVPSRPAFPTAATTQETTVTTVAKVTPGDCNNRAHRKFACSFRLLTITNYMFLHRPLTCSLSFFPSSLWPNGSRIRVRFNGGTPDLWARVSTKLNYNKCELASHDTHINTGSRICPVVVCFRQHYICIRRQRTL